MLGLSSIADEVLGQEQQKVIQYNIKVRVMGEWVSASPLSIQKKLFGKYSASQVYFYPNMINHIVKERRSIINIFYEDIEYLIDLEENLKRWYHAKEFDNKMFTFKEYYFYHQDCPRIFMKPIEETYAKWQDKKRDLVYKKLKLIYNESYTSSADSQADDQKSQNYVAMSHFLLQISEYNPYSKKYYLRAEARKEKEKKRMEEEKKNHSKRDLQNLQHELSAMLHDLSSLSEISTLDSNDSPLAFDKERPKGKIRNYIRQKYQQISKSNSTNLSNSNSLIKFNFKKKKESVEKLLNLKEFKANNKSNSREKDSIAEARISPKMINHQISTQLLKTKSIFTVSSFGSSHKNQELKNYASKKEPLKINFEPKKLTIQQPKKFETEKKKEGSLPKTISIKNKSISKLEKRGSIEKMVARQGSVGKMVRYDEFSDKKMNGEGHNQFRMRSLKSEFVSSGNKKQLIHFRPALELQRGKRVLQLKYR